MKTFPIRRVSDPSVHNFACLPLEHQLAGRLKRGSVVRACEWCGTAIAVSRMAGRTIREISRRWPQDTTHLFCVDCAPLSGAEIAPPSQTIEQSRAVLALFKQAS